MAISNGQFFMWPDLFIHLSKEILRVLKSCIVVSGIGHSCRREIGNPDNRARVWGE
jgi:hypothetical protein